MKTEKKYIITVSKFARKCTPMICLIKQALLTTNWIKAILTALSKGNYKQYG